MTDEELDAILPQLTPEEEELITNPEEIPQGTDAWANIKPEDYWL